MAGQGDKIPENVFALLDRSNALADGVVQRSERKKRRDAEMAEDAAFLEYTTRTQKHQHEMQLKDSMQPLSNEVTSNYDSIVAMLASRDADRKKANAASPKRPARREPANNASASPSMSLVGQTISPAGRASRPDFEASAEGALATEIAQADDAEDFGFAVDTDFAVAFNKGKPLPQAPQGAAGDVGVDDVEDDEATDAALSANFSFGRSRRSGLEVAIGKRKLTSVTGDGDGAQVVKGNRALQQKLSSVLGPPPKTAAYAHELAHLFNMLDSNNIVLVATERDDQASDAAQQPASPGGAAAEVAEYRNQLCVLSPTNGFRLREHLDTPADQPRLIFTSHGWVVRQNLLAAILQGRVDFEYMAKLQQQLETTYTDLKVSEALLAKKDEEIARTKCRVRALEGTTEGLVSKNRMRRAFLVQLALAMKQALDEKNTREGAKQVSRSRSAVLADFILRADTVAEDEEEVVLGQVTERANRKRAPTAPSAMFSTFDELHAALRAYEEHQQQQQAQLLAMQTSFGGAPALDMDMVSGFEASVLSPGGAMDAMSLMSPAAAGTRGSGNSPPQAMPGSAASPHNAVSSMIGQQAHEALLRKLQKKVELAQRRRNYERRMEQMERAAMEGEDAISASNTVFRYGEHGWARLRDILAMIPADVLERAVASGSSLRHAPLASAAAVICPCCKFDFDPSKPAAFYRDAIIARQRKAREAMQKKSAEQAAPVGLHKGAKSGGTKMALPQNLASSGGGGKKSGKDTGTSAAGPAAGSMSASGGDTGEAMFAVMALQESVDELQKQTKQMEQANAELAAEVEIANLNAAAAQEKSETIGATLTAENEVLKEQVQTVTETFTKTKKELELLEKDRKTYATKLANMEKAAESAFEQLEQHQATERKVMELNRQWKLQKGVDDDAATWHDIGSTYFRKYQELYNQIRQLGHTPVETVDVYSGGDAPFPVLVSKTTEYEDVTVDPDFEYTKEVAIDARPLMRDHEAQRTPRTYKPMDTQTTGIQMVLRPMTKPDREKSKSDTADDSVHSVLMRKDIYSQLLKASDYNDVMREYIREMEARDKQEQEKHEREIKELKALHAKALKDAKAEVHEHVKEALEAMQRAKEKEQEVNRMSNLLDTMRVENEKLKNTGPKVVTLTKPVEAPRKPVADRMTSPAFPPGVRPDPTTAGSPYAGSGGAPRRGAAGEMGVGDDGVGTCDAGEGNDVYMPYEQIYRPSGAGRAVVRRVHMRTPAEVEEEEARMREELIGQYVSFTIPLPMLLMLLMSAKAEATVIVERVEAKARRQQARMRQMLEATEVLLGGDLGVSANLPAHFLDRSKRRDGDEGDHGHAADVEAMRLHLARRSGARVLKGHVMPELKPSEKDPVTGAYIRDQAAVGHRHGKIIAGAASIRHDDGSGVSYPPAAFTDVEVRGSVLYKSGHVVNPTRPEVLLTALLQEMQRELHDGSDDEEDPLELKSPTAGDASASASPKRRFARVPVEHNMDVAGASVLGAASPSRSVFEGAAPPSNAAHAAAVAQSAAERKHRIDELRKQQQGQQQQLTTAKARDGGPILDAILRGHVEPPHVPPAVLTSPQARAAAAAKLQARSASPAPEHAPSSTTPRDLAPLRGVPTALSKAAIAPSDAPPRDAPLSGATVLRGAAAGKSVAHDAIDETAATPQSPSAYDRASPARNTAGDAHSAHQVRDHQRRTQLVMSSNYAEVGRIRALRGVSSTADSSVPDLPSAVVGQLPASTAVGPSRHRASAPPVSSVTPDPLKRPPPDITSAVLSNTSTTLGLRHGMTGATRQSLAVRRPVMISKTPTGTGPATLHQL